MRVELPRLLCVVGTERKNATRLCQAYQGSAGYKNISLKIFYAEFKEATIKKDSEVLSEIVHAIATTGINCYEWDALRQYMAHKIVMVFIL